MGDEDRLLTVAQVAERLQVNPETVRRWLRSGRLRGILLGDRAGYRVGASELRRFVEELRGKAA
ncbi:MAG: helix-turn-helix domain-containing protein [Chloroflexi bacterium]|nr:helix-turn-helix domain-containing protein [Chloroflexota bacterium]